MGIVVGLAWLLAAGCGDGYSSHDPDAGPNGDATAADASDLDGGADGSAGGEWVDLPSGTFMMGSPESEPCRVTTEQHHEVTLTRPFELMSTEVTKDDFALRRGYDPSQYSAVTFGGNTPVERVSWHESAAYCNTLSVEAGLTECYTCTGSDATVVCEADTSFEGPQIYTCPGYRLPTEAEWEYAYRAGTTTAYYSGTNDAATCESCGFDPNADAIGWYCGNYVNTPMHPVGSKEPNAWGLYDMAGSVSEWTHDNWTSSLGTDPVTDPSDDHGMTSWTLRGGSWGSSAVNLRAAWRMGAVRSTKLDNLGFRCARTLAP